MWLGEDGRSNVMAVEDPADYLTPELRGALNALPPRELVGLELRVDRIREHVMMELHGSLPEDEDDFVEKDLPPEYVLELGDPARDLFEQIEEQILATPRRWRLERAFLVPQYVAEIGPRPRKHARIVERLLAESDLGASSGELQ